jgi:hypothetical protein
METKHKTIKPSFINDTIHTATLIQNHINCSWDEALIRATNCTYILEIAKKTNSITSDTQKQIDQILNINTIKHDTQKQLIDQMNTFINMSDQYMFINNPEIQ